MLQLAALRGFASSASGMIFLAMLAAFLIQTARIEGFKVWPVKIGGLKDKLADAKAERDRLAKELRDISTAKNEQGKATERNITKARDRIVYVDRKAREIEAAPLIPGACRTPDAIMRSPDL